MNKAFLIFFIAISVVSSSCRRPTVASPEEELSPAGKLVVNEIDYAYFTSKAKVHYADAKSSMGFTVVIRMKKDSAIWFSASPALGIEAARALITPDSVKILDRINNQYLAYSIAFIRHKLNVDLTFENLQSMLMGNLVVPKGKNDKLGDSDIPDCVVLAQENGSLKVANYVSRLNNKVIRLKVNEAPTGNELLVDYDEFGSLENYLFPYKNLIKAIVLKEGKQESLEITIQHNKAEISNKPLNFAFNVPKKFESK